MKWTEQQLYIVRNYSLDEACAALPFKSRSAIRKKRHELNITSTTYKRWSDADCQNLLRDIDALAQKYNTTPTALARKIVKLNPRKWTEA